MINDYINVYPSSLFFGGWYTNVNPTHNLFGKQQSTNPKNHNERDGKIKKKKKKKKHSLKF